MKLESLQIFKALSIITLDIEGSNISNTGWYPHDIEIEYMTEDDSKQALSEAKNKDAKVLFTNVYLNYDSCDCNDGMCSHGSWVFEIIVMDNENRHEIDVQEEYLQVYRGNKVASVPIECSVYDFYRMCELMGVKLEFSDYAKSLIKAAV